MADTTQQAEKEVQVTGVTKFGIGQISNPTPMWVTWAFRIEFIANKAFMMWVASSDDTTNVKQIVLWATIIDFVVWGLGRFVGISKEDFEKS